MELTEQQVKSLSIANKKKLIREFYKSDIYRYFADLVYTLDEYAKTGENPVKRYPLDSYKYTRQLIKDIQNEKWLYLWKSRQVMATWTLLAFALWLVLFNEGKKVAIQSEKADKANALIKRMEFIYNHLPSWKPKAIFTENHIEVPEMFSEVFGIASGGEQLRSYSFSLIISDEFGFQTKLEESFGAAKPIVDAGGRFIACTTPPREKNFSYQLYRNKLFKVVTLHYSLIPGRDEHWAKESKQGWSEDDWNREQELTVVEAGVKRLFPIFTLKSHVNPGLLFNPYMTLFRSWDFGFHRPAVSYYQIDQLDRVNKLYEILGSNILLEDFKVVVIKETNLRFPKAQMIQDFCDIAGVHKSDKHKLTSIQILNSAPNPIIPRYRKVDDEDGYTIIRQKMKTYIGDRPAYQVHPDCIHSIDAYTFGAIYGQDGVTPKGDGVDEFGEKEKGYWLHLIDTDKYFFGNVYTEKGDPINSQMKNSALKNPNGPPNTIGKVRETNPYAWMNQYRK